MFYTYQKLAESNCFFKNLSLDDKQILYIHYKCESIQKIITCVTKSKVLGTGAVSRAQPTELTQRELQVADRGGPLGRGLPGYNTESLSVDLSG